MNGRARDWRVLGTGTSEVEMTEFVMKARVASRFGVLEDAVRLVVLVRPLVAQIAKHDKSLAVQLHKAAGSVSANVAEGMHRRGGHQRERFETAYGSAQEVKTHLRVAWGFELLHGGEPAFDLADKIAASIWRCQHRRR
ncbi:MAG: four helix bundle protein [Sandaracinaceae bacterium]